MILDEPWVNAADRHRAEKATIILNMFKTVVASRTAIVAHSCIFVWRFVAFCEELWLFVVQFSYGLVTIPVQFAHN